MSPNLPSLTFWVNLHLIHPKQVRTKLPMKLRLHRSYRNILLTFFCIGNLLLSSISWLITPHYLAADDLAFRGVRDLIWSNESVPILSPRDACFLPPNASSPEILVMVTSALLNFGRRASIRNTWADTSLVREGKIKVIFVLGQKLGGLRASQVRSRQICKGPNDTCDGFCESLLLHDSRKSFWEPLEQGDLPD